MIISTRSLNRYKIHQRRIIRNHINSQTTLKIISLWSFRIINFRTLTKQALSKAVKYSQVTTNQLPISKNRFITIRRKSAKKPVQLKNIQKVSTIIRNLTITTIWKVTSKSKHRNNITQKRIVNITIEVFLHNPTKLALPQLLKEPASPSKYSKRCWIIQISRRKPHILRFSPIVSEHMLRRRNFHKAKLTPVKSWSWFKLSTKQKFLKWANPLNNLFQKWCLWFNRLLKNKGIKLSKPSLDLLFKHMKHHKDRNRDKTSDLHQEKTSFTGNKAY